MRAPEFWLGRGAVSNLLWPASKIYAAATRRRLRKPATIRPPVPVICVGNLTAGGTGKTPVAHWLAAALTGRGQAPHVVTRGYRGREAGPLRVDPDRHDFRDVGDEPLLLATRVPTWVARDRAAGAQAAVAAGAGVLILDDGFQNPAVAKDLSLVVVDGGYGFGNRRILPAGPLREPVGAGLARADAVVIVGEDREEVAAEVRTHRPDLPVFHARFVPDEAAQILAGRRVVALAGIGRPDKFFDTLKALGADLVEALPFPDHHAFSENDLMLAADLASERDAIPVTTEKDFVRLPPEARPMFTPVPVTLAWQEEAAFLKLLTGVLSGSSATAGAAGSAPGGPTA